MMKHLPKKLIGLLCTFLLLMALLPSAAGSQTMYFMAVNDKILDYSADTMPFVSDGTVYVPYQMFIAEHNGGVSLGVFYGVYEKYDINALSLYSRNEPILTFDRNGVNAYDAAGNTYSFHAITRNGITFVPASSVCTYFGLQYSYLPNDYGVLIRVKSEPNKTGGYWLNDRLLTSSARLKFIEQKKMFDKVQADSSLSPNPPPVSPSLTPSTDKSQVKVSFAFRCEGETGAAALLNTLSGSSAKALFFFSSQTLSQQDEQIRRLLAQGHRVGFLVEGTTAAQCLAQAEEGNRLLSHIARTKSDFLLVDDPALFEELTAQGWVCWKGNVAGIPTQDIRPASLSANIILNIEAKRNYARILMDDSATSLSALQRLLPQIEQGGYTFHSITEPDLT